MDRLIALAAIAQSLYRKWVFKHLLYNIVAIVMLFMVASIMLSAMLVTAFYAGYQAMLHAGIDPYHAMLYLAGTATAVLLLFVLVIMILLRRVREMPRRLLQKKAPSVSRANDVVHAFLAGLLDVQP